MIQETFRRAEKKYMLTAEQYQELLCSMITKITADEYGKHTICNLYFDSYDYRLIRDSLEKPVYKEKIRLRSYGAAREEDMVFLELKKKYDGIVYKRREPMKLGEARAYLCSGVLPRKDLQILREIDYARRMHQAFPRVYLAYERIAFSGKEDPELRITFDMNIRARDYNLDLGCAPYGTPLLEKGRILMEVKIPGAMPLWMSHLLSELHIYPVSYSKYGTYYTEYLAGKQAWDGSGKEGGRICA